MPEDLSIERAQTLRVFGTELILTPKSAGVEYSRDMAEQMQKDGKGRVLDPFANPENPRIHYEITGPETWTDTAGTATNFVSAMGTTGTITDVSRYLKEKNPAVKINGAQMCRCMARKEGIFAGISVSRRLLGGAGRRQKGRGRGDRVHCVRPGRPLPVHRRVSCVMNS